MFYSITCINRAMHSTKHAVLWLIRRGKTLLFRPKWEEKRRNALKHRCQCAAAVDSGNCNIPIRSVNFMRSRWCQLGFSVLKTTYFSPTFGWRQVIAGMAANSPCRRWFFSRSLFIVANVIISRFLGWIATTYDEFYFLWACLRCSKV